MTVRAAEFLQELVVLRSVSGCEDNAARFLEERLPGLGWEKAWVDEVGNIRAIRGQGPRSLVLMGHIDTVPGGPEVRREGDVLWGRGSVDAKGPFTAMAFAGGSAAVPEGWQIELIGAVGEERDSRGAKYLLSRLDPDGCVIGEPSGTRGVTIGYRGRMLLHLAAADGGAHRSGDAGPSTAVVRAAVALLDWVESKDEPSARVIDRPFASVLWMRGQEGEGRQAEMEMDLRLPAGADLSEWRRSIEACLKSFGVGFEIIDEVEAHQVSRTDPLVRSFVKALRSEGDKPVLLLKGGTADFNLAAGWGCPMVAYGPGDSRLDHSSEEHLHLEELESAIAILKRALVSFMESGIGS